MSDFIEEFNIIDFMGMIFPGSVTVLLFGAETDLWYKMETLWGATPEMAAKLVFIIAMGYFAGMLLHEVGDILEYLTGWNTPLNPRGWAAVVTGFARVSIPQYDSEAEKRSECRQQVKSAFGAMIFLVENAQHCCYLRGREAAYTMDCLPAVGQIGAGLGREYAEDSGAHVKHHGSRAVLLLRLCSGIGGHCMEL